MVEDFKNFLIDSHQLENTLNYEVRTKMSQMIEFPNPFLCLENSPLLVDSDPKSLEWADWDEWDSEGGASSTPLHVSPPCLLEAAHSEDKHASSILEKSSPITAGAGGAVLGQGTAICAHSVHTGLTLAVMTLVGKILQDLESNVSRLLTLNPSRREGIVQYLSYLSGMSPSHLSNISPSEQNLDSSLRLRRWVEGSRTPLQDAALKTYFEEIAMMTLGQALVLKNWSDRKVRLWCESDLGRLNWVLSMALKPYLPLDREGWQVTRPNLYSWYNPHLLLQREIWKALEPWKLTQEGPSFLVSLLKPIRKASPEIQVPSGYDPRFFNSLWENIHLFNFDPTVDKGPLKRHKVVFSPTLRDGAMMRASASSLVWIGLEASPVHLMMAELMQIWWQPGSPPFWSIGTGLEVHTRDQLALALHSPKPSVMSRIAEMEACDVALVLEEQVIRAQGKNIHSTRFRELVEKLPYFKRLRTAGTSLGALQACVSVSKLRPGGLFFWAREEVLSSKDGHEMLSFLLERAKLCMEWDFSELEHSLPASLPLYPKHLYLFQKEPHLETRLSYRPVKHVIQGQLRSHIELSLVLNDAFQFIQEPIVSHGSWTLLSHTSPTPQRDWLAKWPDPTSQSMIRQLDQLRLVSLQLAHFTTIRPTPDGDPQRHATWAVPPSLHGFWVTAECEGNERRLVTRAFPRPGHEKSGSGFLVMMSDEQWAVPLSAYLLSDLVKKWLECHVERRGERWILNEQVVKWIPVPKILLRCLGVRSPLDSAGEVPSESIVLPYEWEKLAAEVPYHPQMVQEALQKLQPSELQKQIHACLFIRTARALDQLQFGQGRLFSLVTPDGQIRWRELVDILPKEECTTLSLHPHIRLSGNLPSHFPVNRMERVNSPLPGILLTTESGFNLHVGSEHALLITMIWEQLEGLVHPTWNELLHFLQVPRKMELAESTALDVLRAHQTQTDKLKQLHHLLNTCQLI